MGRGCWPNVLSERLNEWGDESEMGSRNIPNEQRDPNATLPRVELN